MIGLLILAVLAGCSQPLPHRPPEGSQITNTNGTSPVPVFVHDSVDLMAVIVDGSPRAPGLVTP